MVERKWTARQALLSFLRAGVGLQILLLAKMESVVEHSSCADSPIEQKAAEALISSAWLTWLSRLVTSFLFPPFVSCACVSHT